MLVKLIFPFVSIILNSFPVKQFVPRVKIVCPENIGSAELAMS